MSKDWKEEFEFVGGFDKKFYFVTDGEMRLYFNEEELRIVVDQAEKLLAKIAKQKKVSK